MSTILKWAGNKTAIMPELKKHLPAGPRLVEPFAGSCAVMMETDYPSYLVADINPDLINLYKKVAADCELFISRARALFEEANREVAYYNIRQEFNYSTEITDFMKAVYFLYLNRHGYRGLCRYNKSGHFNIPYGNYKNPYFPEKEIRAFAEKAQRATFICASFDETLAMLKAGDVVYCDPPYDGTFSGYHTDGFTEDDQYHLASVLEHRLRQQATSRNTSVRTLTGVVWLARSARKRVNPCVITLNTLMPGRLCIVFSNSASLAFRGVRLTVNCDCWLVRRQGNRGTKKQVRRYWITRALMQSWLLLMLVVLPLTS